MRRFFCVLLLATSTVFLKAQTADSESAAVLAALVRQNDAEVAELLARGSRPSPGSPRETARILKLCAAA